MKKIIDAGLTGAVALLACLYVNNAVADSTDQLTNLALQITQSCHAALNSSPEQGMRCAVDNGVNQLIGKGVELANERGRAQFGEHFQITSRLNWSSDNGQTEVSGDLDVVAPLSFAGNKSPLGGVSSFFTQQGVTRFRDTSGAMRNDLRHGVAYRFRLNKDPESDIIGISSFYQHSAEYQHKVMVLGMDYAGRWGTGAFRYFNPSTRWRHSYSGLEQRALEGMELSGKLNLTTAIDLSATGYRWEAEDGSGRWEDGTRLELGWRPHTWLRFVAGYDQSTQRKAESEFRMEVAIPLGGPPNMPRPYWQGFGDRVQFNSTTPADLWRPVEGIGQIRLATRNPESIITDGQDIGVRFLDAEVNSGQAVRVEVFVEHPAASDIAVMLTLEPGDSVNPAIAGEDFVDEPVYGTISEGSMSTIVSIPLLENNDMEQPRSLSVAVSTVS